MKYQHISNTVILLPEYKDQSHTSIRCIILGKLNSCLIENYILNYYYKSMCSMVYRILNNLNYIYSIDEKKHLQSIHHHNKLINQIIIIHRILTAIAIFNKLINVECKPYNNLDLCKFSNNFCKANIFFYQIINRMIPCNLNSW